MNTERTQFSAAEFHALYSRLKEGSMWGSSDRRGALNYVTTARVLTAIGEVRSGRTVSLARPVEGSPSADNPEPCQHQMTGGVGAHSPTGLDFAMDRFVMNVHGNADSHIDALSHVIYDGELYNDVSVDTLSKAGASTLAIDVAHAGIVGRGVLLDIPRLRGSRWLEPGDHVTVDDLVAAERAQHLRVHPGDLLFVRVGHSRRRSEMLGINAMGLHLLDYLRFEDLVQLCEQENRWSFLCVIAPLRLPAATGSPVNPIAIL